jgi:SAM-dependent methyltransferase
MLDPRPGQSVVDLGAGPGFFDEELLKWIGQQGRLFLVDIDEENLDLARRRFPDDARVSFWVGSAAKTSPIPSGSADRVLMSLVLCCLSDKSGALDEAWRLLSPGGRLLVTYPRGGSWSRLRRRSLRVTQERWAWLTARHPWGVLPVHSGWLVIRHLLEKPDSH